MGSIRPDCDLDATHYWATKRGFVSDDGELADTDGCDIPVGVRFSVLVDMPSSTHPSHAKRRHRMEPTTPTPVAAVSELEKDAVVAQVSDDAAAAEKTAAVPAQTEAVVVQPEPAATTAGFDPMAVAQANPILAFGLAILAVVGGGAGWKFWTKMSEQKHEQKMKELELEAQKAGLAGAQPPPCQAKQVEVDAKLASLEGRVAKTERTSVALGDGFDPEDIQKRLATLERAVKRISGGGK